MLRYVALCWCDDDGPCKSQWQCVDVGRVYKTSQTTQSLTTHVGDHNHPRDHHYARSRRVDRTGSRVEAGTLRASQGHLADREISRSAGGSALPPAGHASSNAAGIHGRLPHARQQDDLVPALIWRNIRSHDVRPSPVVWHHRAVGSIPPDGQLRPLPSVRWLLEEDPTKRAGIPLQWGNDVILPFPPEEQLDAQDQTRALLVFFFAVCEKEQPKAAEGELRFTPRRRLEEDAGQAARPLFGQLERQVQDQAHAQAQQLQAQAQAPVPTTRWEVAQSQSQADHDSLRGVVRRRATLMAGSDFVATVPASPHHDEHVQWAYVHNFLATPSGGTHDFAGWRTAYNIFERRSGLLSGHLSQAKLIELEDTLTAMQSVFEAVPIVASKRTLFLFYAQVFAIISKMALTRMIDERTTIAELRSNWSNGAFDLGSKINALIELPFTRPAVTPALPTQQIPPHQLLTTQPEQQGRGRGGNRGQGGDRGGRGQQQGKWGRGY
jgi:hypothetical protein